MGEKFLIDTNAVIEFLSGNIPDSGTDWMQEIITNNLHNLSVINQIELLVFKGTNNEMQTLKDFIDSTNVLPLSPSVVNQTIEIRKRYKTKLPDAIIASTAIVYNLTLVTRNTGDFQNISGLNLLNTHTIEP